MSMQTVLNQKDAPEKILVLKFTTIYTYNSNLITKTFKKSECLVKSEQSSSLRQQSWHPDVRPFLGEREHQSTWAFAEQIENNLIVKPFSEIERFQL